MLLKNEIKEIPSFEEFEDRSKEEYNRQEGYLKRERGNSHEDKDSWSLE